MKKELVGSLIKLGMCLSFLLQGSTLHQQGPGGSGNFPFCRNGSLIEWRVADDL